RRPSAGMTARKNFFAKKKNESCGRDVPRWRERVCLSKKLEVTCYAESFMASGGGYSFSRAFHLSRAGRDLIGAFEFGSGNGRNRRQRDANRDAGQPDRQLRDANFGGGNRAQSAAHFARCSPNRARPEYRPDGRPGRQDFRLHAREQLESHQGADRRNRCERPKPGRRLRFWPGPYFGHRAGGSAARSAKQFVWVGRDRWRGQYRDEERRRAAAVHRTPGGRFVRYLQPIREYPRIGLALQLLVQRRASSDRRY